MCIHHFLNLILKYILKENCIQRLLVSSLYCLSHKKQTVIKKQLSGDKRWCVQFLQGRSIWSETFKIFRNVQPETVTPLWRGMKQIWQHNPSLKGENIVCTNYLKKKSNNTHSYNNTCIAVIIKDLIMRRGKWMWKWRKIRIFYSFNVSCQAS